MAIPFFDTIAGSTATTSNLAVGGSRSGFVNSTFDQDWHRLFLVAGQTYIFDADGIGLSDATVSLRNAFGGQLVFNDDGGPGLDSRIEFTAASTGTYYLDVGGFGSRTGSYAVRARIDDVADDVETTDAIAVGGSRLGVVNSADDSDFFRVNLVAGQSYIFDTTGLSLTDSTLTLRNSAGAQLAFDDDGGPGLNSRIEFTAASSGTYYLNVDGFSNRTGSYSLQARVDDASDDINGVDAIAVGGSRSGVINSTDDSDFFRVSLVAGQSYIFDVDGVGLSDSTLTLRNSAGAQIAFDDDGGLGLDSRIEFTAAASGTYYLDVDGFSNRTGSYNVSARVDDAADDISGLDAIAVNGFRTGVINSTDDSDFFRVNLTAGRTYAFLVDGISLTDPTVTLRNSAGVQLAFNDDGGPGLDSRLQFTAASSGTYYVDVDGFSNRTGSYRVDADLIA